jgi:hypothetical protein
MIIMGIDYQTSKVMANSQMEMMEILEMELKKVIISTI